MNDINQEPNSEQNKEQEITNHRIPPPKQKLYKSYKNVILTGVCGGIAERFYISPIFVRFIFVLLAFLGGWGIILYIILSFLISEHPSAKKKTFEKIDSKRLFGFALLITGIYFYFGLNFLGIFDPFSFADTIFFPIVLAIAGIWILAKGRTKFIYTSVIKQKRLYRSREQRILLGICGGLSDYMYTDVNIIRLLWVILSFATLGIGIIIYFLLSLFIQPEQKPAADEK